MKNRFNLLKFNIGQTEKYVDFSNTAEFGINGVVITVQDIEFESSVFQSLTGSVSVIHGIPFGNTAQQEVNGIAEAARYVAFSDYSNFNLNADVFIEDEIFIEDEAKIGITGDCALYKNIWFQNTASAGVESAGEHPAGKNIVFECNIGNVLTGSVDITNVQKTFLQIDTALKPGQTLIIDSENYNVLIDNENVIDRHNGGWVWLSRDTLSIDVGMQISGQIEGKAVFTERYL